MTMTKNIVTTLLAIVLGLIIGGLLFSVIRGVSIASLLTATANDAISQEEVEEIIDDVTEVASLEADNGIVWLPYDDTEYPAFGSTAATSTPVEAPVGPVTCSEYRGPLSEMPSECRGGGSGSGSAGSSSNNGGGSSSNNGGSNSSTNGLSIGQAQVSTIGDGPKGQETTKPQSEEETPKGYVAPDPRLANTGGNDDDGKDLAAILVEQEAQARLQAEQDEQARRDALAAEEAAKVAAEEAAAAAALAQAEAEAQARADAAAAAHAQSLLENQIENKEEIVAKS